MTARTNAFLGIAASVRPRLARLAHLADDPGVLAISVDLYDTLLLRRCRPELWRFADVARAQDAALVRAGLASPGAAALYRARLRVHKACHDRVRDGPGEVRQADVAAGVAAALGLTGAAAGVLAAAETDHETTAVRPDRALAALLVRLARDRPVVLTSDMYLPAAAVRRVLATAVPDLAGLPLFVSGEIGLTKRHGHLFGHVAAALDLPPAAILHVGDNPLADVRRAREAGFRALWWPRPWWWRRALAAQDRLVRWRLRRAGAIPRG
ncbi:MAG: HAD-IA family hydrolase [Rhodospirillales bacterium]